MIPATTVGSANGRSITEFTIALPGKLVPDQDPGDRRAGDHVDHDHDQRGDQGRASAPEGRRVGGQRSRTRSSPPSVDCATRAAIGIRTMTLRYAVTRPRPSAAPPRRGHGRPRGLGAGAGYGASSVATPRLLDPGVTRWRPPGPARSWRRCRCSRIEELGRWPSPSRRARIVDREQPGRGRELLLVLGEHGLSHRPVAAVGPELLRLRRPQELEEVLRLRRGVGGGRGRRLDQDRVVGDDVVDVLAGLLGLDRVALVGEQDVALALVNAVSASLALPGCTNGVARAASSGTPAPPRRDLPSSIWAAVGGHAGSTSRRPS